MVRRYGPKLEAWRPCLTAFCSQPSASITLVRKEYRSDPTTWIHSAETVLQQTGFSNFVTREIRGDAGASTCIEGTKAGGPADVAGTCFNPETDIAATLLGKSKDVGVFYRIVASARGE
jgi:hypothetical protein